jgi:hypothetical protein
VVAGAVLVLSSAVVPSPAATPGCPDPTWHVVGQDKFPSLIGGSRSQGVTTDGRRWWFSWQGGLSRTNAEYLLTGAMLVAIPPDLIMRGSNHIGDIDIDRGRLIAPIEDGGPLVGESNKPEHRHPWLVMFDPVTLLPTGERYQLPRRLQRDGVPWVAVDHVRRRAITAEWNDAVVLNEWDIDHGMRLARRLPLARPVGRIQGAKVWGRWLYASQDDEAKSIIRVDLTSGAVETLYQLGFEGESEGIAVWPTPDGALLHVLFVRGSIDDLLHLRTTLYHLAPRCP